MSEPGSIIRSLSGRTAARNFHSYVLNEIGVGIVSGRFPVGSVLPNDAEMMSLFDVSRTVLREALKTIESKGLVEARPKVGTKVAPRNRWNYFDSMVLAWHFEAGPQPALLKSVADIRLALEPGAAAEMAVQHTADQMRLMNYWLVQMEKSLFSPVNFAMADFELHLSIAEASKNRFIRSMAGVVEFAHAAAYRLRMAKDPPGLEESLELHRQLVHAIEGGKADLAASTLQTAIAQDLDAGLFDQG